MSDSNHFIFSYEAVTLKQGGAVYSELWTICLSNFSAIPAVHHCHKLIIDQRLMRLMFTVGCLLLYPHHSYVSFAQWYVRHQNCKIKQDLQVWFPVTITTLVPWYWAHSEVQISLFMGTCEKAQINDFHLTPVVQRDRAKCGTVLHWLLAQQPVTIHIYVYCNSDLKWL